MNEDEYKVQIQEIATGRVEWESGVVTYRAAEKIAQGAGINLDWSRFSVEIETADA